MFMIKGCLLTPHHVSLSPAIEFISDGKDTKIGNISRAQTTV